MTVNEALKIVEKLGIDEGYVAIDVITDYIEYLEKALYLRDKDSSCDKCAFFDREDWDMPCAKCSRNSKDYYRYKPQVDED